MVARFLHPAPLAWRRASYVAGPRLPERSVDLLGEHAALDDYAASHQIELDRSDQSIACLDRQLGRLPEQNAAELLKDIAVYLGDTLAGRLPGLYWSLDAADYPLLRGSRTAAWDVITFVHRREEGGGMSLLEGLAELTRRFGAAEEEKLP